MDRYKSEMRKGQSIDNSSTTVTHIPTYVWPNVFCTNYSSFGGVPICPLASLSVQIVHCHFISDSCAGRNSDVIKACSDVTVVYLVPGEEFAPVAGGLKANPAASHSLHGILISLRVGPSPPDLSMGGRGRRQRLGVCCSSVVRRVWHWLDSDGIDAGRTQLSGG